MGRLSRLGEEALKISGSLKSRDGRSYQFAREFLVNGILPNGARVADGPPKLIVRLGDSSSCEISRLSQKKAADDACVIFDVGMSVHPSRAGGAGVGVDVSITDFFIAQANGGPCSDSARFPFGAALYDVCVERKDSIRDSFRGLFSSDGGSDFIWRVAGWGQRDKWLLDTVGGVEVTRISFGNALVDERRGESWPAKGWEAWVPVSMDVMATLRRK